MQGCVLRLLLVYNGLQAGHTGDTGSLHRTIVQIGVRPDSTLAKQMVFAKVLTALYRQGVLKIRAYAARDAPKLKI